MSIKSNASGSNIFAVAKSVSIGSYAQSGSKIYAVVGRSFVTGGSTTPVSIASPKGTIAVTGSNNIFTLEVAKQAATNGQALIWSDTLDKWSPGSAGTGTVTAVSFSAPASNAFTVATASTTPAIAFQNTGADPAGVFLRGDGQWSTGGVTPQTLYDLTDVSLPQETATSYVQQVTSGINLATVFPNQITVVQTGAISPATIFAVGQQVTNSNSVGSPIFTVASISNYVSNAWRIIFTKNVSGWNAPQNPITVYYPVTGAIPDGNALVWSQTNKYWTNGSNVASVQALATGTPSGGAIRFLAGNNVSLTQTITATGADIMIASTGGGSGTFTASTIWTGGTASKNAYSGPGAINNQGITLNLVASSGSGAITNMTVSLNGVAIPIIYGATGSFPNYVLNIPVTDISGVAAQTAASVTVSVTGSFNGSNFNIVNAGTLTNVQPVAFTASLSASYAQASVAYYTTTTLVNYSYTSTGSITSRNGTLNTIAATNASGSIATGTSGVTIAGSAVGDGQFGAPTNVTIPLSGSVPGPNLYIPAFYGQTTNSTPPTFTTAGLQTAGAAAGSTITYPAATASTQYCWVCTQRPLANIAVATPLGNTPLTPDVTAPTQIISGQTFSVYGFTSLAVGTSAQLVIS